MPAVARVGDTASGHPPCFPQTSAVSGSPNVFANGLPVVRQGDVFTVHCCGDSCHTPSVASGSSTVLVNGKPIARVGDVLSCGSVISSGSPNVFAN